ncbi:Gametocyte-specific factor 1 [Frankliniella fusca]|uniref:Gametocyte-specific factor 1 n=1 Tax=Frankliniella fusca TaxID=407009 RepID=A0AAE1HKA5_9NEOP|nr:Gametocyte-specific factor 1 [Frankliniella fusca]
MYAAINNPFVSCPYDKAHSVPKLRLQRHLLKCRVNHPKLAAIMKSCPFNATHIMPEAELRTHFYFCNDRNLVEGQKYLHTPVHGELGNPEFHLPVPVGDWDEPDDEDPIEQIYGHRNNNGNIPERDEFEPGGALSGISNNHAAPARVEDERPIMPSFMGMGRGRLHARLRDLDNSD